MTAEETGVKLPGFSRSWKMDFIKNSRLRARLFRIILGVIFTTWLLSGCLQQVDWTWLTGSPTPPLMTATFTPSAAGKTATAAKVSAPINITPSPGGLPTPPGLATLQKPATTMQLVVWVPPDFYPTPANTGSDLLKARIQSFEKLYPNVQVQIRVKALSGPSGLLEALTTTSAAAPAALPSIIALPRSDLETAAIKSLIQPLDKYTRVIDNPDWYTYARQLALVQNTVFGIPFAGDALILAYRPLKTGVSPVDWQTIQRINQPIGFAAADPQALFTLALYQSAGGQIEDTQRRPVLQVEPLSQVLKLYADGLQRGYMPLWLTQYDTSGQVWQAFREQRVNLLVTWSSQYLASLPADATAQVIPPLGGSPLSLMTGYAWALSEPVPEKREMAVRLAEYLSFSEFLGRWTETAGFLPPRPSALASWQNQSMQNIFSQVVIAAQLRPSNEVLNSLGPVLSEATIKVLKRESDPIKAAQAAAERIAARPTR